MTIIEKQLIKSLVLNEITKETFLAHYPIDLSVEDRYILHVLQSSYQNRDEDALEYGLMLLPLDNFTESTKYVEILNKLIQADWHKMHEDIASLLNGINSPESVDALFNAAVVQYDYLSYDDTYQLARKCIKALAAIANMEAIERIKELSLYEIPEIAAYARKELLRKGFDY
ncbi:hypothetical protein SAMN05428949_0400 [Chitinophaga sp. YR627]|uniref:hypothetical protein n=1 Tax=Chitinophaga sp. YR627 TaxID=1881041 RepID=UPI0008E70261|nr:hypothetical protein [Chitinophaga sp. YR627]SFM67658.1 hypothetical protein SAMN05428949_0400 [Chitinophaga sp. YR627]